MTQTEALKLALEALEVANSLVDGYYLPKEKAWLPEIEEAITAIKAALEAKDEPVAWQYRDANDDGTWSAWTGCDKRLTESDWRKVRPLYTTPPQPVIDESAAKRIATALGWEPKRKPLTDEEIEDMWQQYCKQWKTGEKIVIQFVDFARAIEAAHGIKGEK